MDKKEDLAHIYYSSAVIFLGRFKLIYPETEEKFKLLHNYIIAKKYVNVFLFFEDKACLFAKGNVLETFVSEILHNQYTELKNRGKKFYVLFSSNNFHSILKKLETYIKHNHFPLDFDPLIFSKANKSINWIRKRLAYDIAEAYYLEEKPLIWNKLYVYCTQIQKSFEEAVYAKKSRHDEICLIFMLAEIKKFVKSKQFTNNSYLDAKEQQLEYSYRKLLPPMLIALLEEWLK